ncbi:Tetratricopeptide TPR1 [Phaffia rhodozyma]|uniref:Tetratricopeptide TPR1 n=1 Tax=Phaffia rhodozyma TaxID=264483 RepID=A0A0F7SKW6_PHARH|nr:Tetratricopeptide TPR1 [Phaffia rhodozyma]
MAALRMPCPRLSVLLNRSLVQSKHLRSFHISPAARSSLPPSSTPVTDPSRPTARSGPIPIPSASQAQPKRPRWMGGKIEMRIFGACFGVLIVVGTYTLYTYVQMYKTWPKEIREYLRQAIKSGEAEDWVRSERAFGKALNAARSMDPPLPLLHTTGIAVAQTHLLLTRLYAPQRAYPVLRTALSDLDEATERLTGAERQRLVGVLYKLAEVAEKLGKVEDEEMYLTRAVEEGLRGVMERRKEIKKTLDEVNQQSGGGREEELEPVPMPSWLSRTDLGACLDKLGEFYMKQGNSDYAAPLYLHAINTILPPTPDEPSKNDGIPTEDRCRAAMMMNNLSNVLTLKPTSENLQAALTWADRSLSTVRTARKVSPEFNTLISGEDRVGDGGKDEKESAKSREWRERRRMCEGVEGVALFNLGVLQEMNKEYTSSIETLQKALAFSRSVGFAKGVQEAQDALNRVKTLRAKASSKEKDTKKGKGFW